MSQSVIAIIIALILALANLTGGDRAEEADSPAPPSPVEETRQPADGDVIGVAAARTNRVLVLESPESGNTVVELTAGDQVSILARDGQWYKVRTMEGDEGFVRRFLVERIAVSRITADETMILGYYVQTGRGSSRASMAQNSDILTAVSPWTWGVTRDGGLHTEHFDSEEMSQTLSLAGEHNLQTYALIHNWEGATFSSDLAAAVLSDPDVRGRLVTNLHEAITEWGFTGIHVDFESVPYRLQDDLTAFIAELAERFHPDGLAVTMAVPAKTAESDHTSDWSGGFDYASLAPHLDHMMVMTYDHHWRGGPPGPVAGITWVDEVINFALDQNVPPEKLVLGVAAYGYDWPRNWNRSYVMADSLTHGEVMGRLNDAKTRDPSVRLQWDKEAKVPYFTYGDRQVWFENHQSLSHKLQLVQNYNLGGIAMWRLGQEDPRSWPLLRSTFGN